MTDRDQRRFDRQIEALAQDVPPLRRLLAALRSGPGRLVRIPLAVLLILGGLFAFLPILGLWMLPAGLILLAIDLPPLRPRVAAALILLRRRLAALRRRLRPPPPPDAPR